VLPVSRRRRAYAALILGTIITAIDSSIANIALPTIGRELHASPAQTVWVASAYLLAITMSLFAVSSLGQSRGPTRIWGIGVALFTFGSLLCVVSSAFPLLIVARVVQGGGAAAIMSLSPALVRDIYPRSMLGHAFGMNAMYTSIASAAGPTVGGMLLAVLPWQWLFAINLPLALLIVLLARGALPNATGTRAPLDPVSMVTSAIGFSLLIYGLDGFARGDALLLILVELVVGGAMFAWFARRQFSLPEPMIALDLFRLPRFSVAAQASFSGWSAWSIGVIALPFFLQLDFGMSPLHSGLLLTTWPIANAVVAPISGRWADRYAVAWISTGGLVVFTLALLLFVYAVVHPSIGLLLGAGLLAGAGWGTFQTPNNRELMGAGPPEKGGSTAAIFASLRVGGQTFGASLAAIVFASFAPSASAHVAPEALHAAVLGALGLACLFSLLATLVSAQRAFRDGFHYHPA
jgi:DHA2 family multidrug resistance protein-like MFS transporter